MNFEPEQAVIAAALRDEEAYWRVADLLTVEDFADSECRMLWAEITNLAKKRAPFDAVTIADRDSDLGRIALSFARAAGVTANARAYAEIVQKRATERRVKSAGQRIAQLRGDDVLGEAQRILASCMPMQSDAIRGLSHYVRESLRGVIDRHNATGELTGVPSSIAELNALTAGYQRGDLIIVAARPSVGKTAFAVQELLHAAENAHPGLAVSLEMTGTQLTDRALAHVGEINALHLRSPKTMDEHEWPRLTAAKEKLDALPIRIDESSSLTVEALCARIRQANAVQRLGLVVVDYLQLLTPPKAEKLTDAWGIVTRQLKGLAKELQIPIVVLSQLNREGDNGKPSMKHLRDSGAIEQDADVILFLWRPEENRKDLVALTIGKQRNGPCETIYLDAQMQYMRFQSTHYEPSTDPPRRGNGRGYGGTHASRTSQ